VSLSPLYGAFNGNAIATTGYKKKVIPTGLNQSFHTYAASPQTGRDHDTEGRDWRRMASVAATREHIVREFGP
jgi:hypothetical protein